MVECVLAQDDNSVGESHRDMPRSCFTSKSKRNNQIFCIFYIKFVVIMI